MPKYKTLSETHNICLANGEIKPITEINFEKIKTLIQNAETNVSAANIIKQAIHQNAKEWMNVYILHYESMRIYAEALLHLKLIQSPNHQCMFAVLCTKFPELELNWDFFEKIRTVRNGVNYYGKELTYNDWKEIELQINLYLGTLKKELEQHINNL